MNELVPDLTPNEIREICTMRGLFDSPELNTILILHQLGLARLPKIEKYSNVRCLYLNENSLTEIPDLSFMPHLKVLYLQVRLAFGAFVS
jgi:dynein assembly factor 1